MSKKKFTDGLESLFGAPAKNDRPLTEDSPLLIDTKEDTAVVTAPKEKLRKRSSSKNFTSDLDSLFEDALQETLEDRTRKVVPKTSTRRIDSKPITGLDALIRRTAESSNELNSEGLRKRVSFIFEKEKLKRLKQIAKAENAYLKDIIGDVMSKFIEKYEREKGNINHNL